MAELQTEERSSLPDRERNFDSARASPSLGRQFRRNIIGGVEPRYLLEL